MAEAEELRILLTTVANTNGATQTQTALRGVRAAAHDATQATQGVTSGFRVGASDALRFAGALTGVQVGLSLAASAGHAIQGAIVGAIHSQAEAQRTARATAAAYGELAGNFTAFAAALSAQTGFTSQSILEAALSARTLSANYGLTIAQTQNLIRVSADLAQVRGIGVAQAFERVQSAIRGEAEASEFLGLTLNDTFIKNNALNGSVRNTFETMTDAQKAQIRYAETLRQTAQFQGLAARGLTDLDGVMTASNTAAANLSTAFGKLMEPQTVTLLRAAALALNDITAALERQRGLKNVKPGLTGGQQVFIPGQGWVELSGTGGEQGISIPGQGIVQVPNAPVAPGVASAEALDVFINAEEAARVANNAQILKEQQLAALGPAKQFLETWRTIDATLINTQDSFARIAQDLAEIQAVSSTLGTLINALGTSNPGLTAELTTLQSIEQIRINIRANDAAAVAARNRALDKEASKITDPRDAAGATAARERVRLIEQLLPLENAVAEAKRQQSEFADAVAANQAAENAVILSILPQRQEIARLEWEMANAVDRRVALRQEETRLLAQQAALAPNNALEDTQATIRRNELLLGIRGQDPAVKRAARLENRNLERNVLGPQELAAFDANQAVVVAQRAENATSLAQQIRDNPVKQQIEGLRLNALAGERTAFALDQNSQVQDLVGKSFTSNTDKMTKALDAFIKKAGEPAKFHLTVDVTGPAGNTVSVHELIEATDRAIIPPAIPQSGVRRPF